jgi:hypothetical protein
MKRAMFALIIGMAVAGIAAFAAAPPKAATARGGETVKG